MPHAVLRLNNNKLRVLLLVGETLYLFIYLFIYLFLMTVSRF
jgi:hypothetical protein